MLFIFATKGTRMHAFQKHSEAKSHNSRRVTPLHTQGVPIRDSAIMHCGMKTMKMNMGHCEVAWLTILRASGKSSRDSHAITPIAWPNRTKTLFLFFIFFLCHWHQQEEEGGNGVRLDPPRV